MFIKKFPPMWTNELRSQRILIRCDGNPETGLGHLSRCINLARSLQELDPNTEVIFWGCYDAFAGRLLTRYGLMLLSETPPSWREDGLPATYAACSDFDVLVLDSYSMDQQYIDGLKNQRCRLAIIDDDQRYDLTDANLVVCFRIGAQMLDYGAKVQLLGPSFLPVSPELYAMRERNLALAAGRAIERVLVFMSGGHLGARYLPVVLRALDIPGIDLAYLASTAVSSPIPACTRYLALTPDISKIYEKFDLVLCGGGLTKYECAFAGIANACLSLTELQAEDTQAMASMGLTLDLGLASALDPEEMRRQLTKFISSPEALAAQRTAFMTQLDSHGPRQLAQTLLSL